jgi:hypothetical protein
MILATKAEMYKAPYDRLMGNVTECSKIANHLGQLVLLALFILGCIVASGAFPGSSLVWATMGLGGLYMAVKLLGGNYKQRKVDLISSAVIMGIVVAFGGLGSAGVLSSVQVGYALIGNILLTAVASNCVMIATKKVDDRRKDLILNTEAHI